MVGAAIVHWCQLISLFPLSNLLKAYCSLNYCANAALIPSGLSKCRHNRQITGKYFFPSIANKYRFCCLPFSAGAEPLADVQLAHVYLHWIIFDKLLWYFKSLIDEDKMHQIIWGLRSFWVHLSNTALRGLDSDYCKSVL